MQKIQILEDETLTDYADFDNNEVWLLNRTTTDELDERIVNVPELTESTLATVFKLPQLMTEIWNKYPNEVVYTEVQAETYDDDGNLVKDDDGNVVYHTEKVITKSEMTFSYEIMTTNKANYEIKSYVCPVQNIHEIDTNNTEE